MQGQISNRTFRALSPSYQPVRKRRLNAVLFPWLLAVVASTLTLSSADAQAATSNTVGGLVFRDVNDDGIFGKSGAVEEGVAGVEVQAFASNGQRVGVSSTDSSGKFSISSATPLPWRLEYARIPVGLEFGRRTRSGGTAVQFAPASAQNYDLALVRPGEICQSDPQLATTCFVLGDFKGEFGPEQTLVRFPSSATGKLSETATERAVVLARHKDMGANYGLAWQPSSGSLFSSAYVKRFSGLGSGGIASIYRDGALAIDLAKLKGASSFGSDPHPTDPKLWERDSSTFSLVGKLGLGDLDVSLDGRQLFTVNMAEKQLVTIPVSRRGVITATSASAADQAPSANQVGQFRIPSPCGTGNWRPMGLAVQSTRVLVGGTCPDELRAVVVGFMTESRTWTAPLLSFGLDFPRGSQGFERMWESWPDNETRVWNRPQLMLSDLSVDGPDLIIGLRDRYGDQTGLQALPADPSISEPYSAGSLGDVVRACSETGTFGETGGWVLESNGSCGGRTTSGQNNTDGPGGGEFYFEDDFFSLGKVLPDTPHSNGFEGSLAALPANDRVAATMIDPLDYFSTGLTVMSNQTGKRTHSYEISQKGSPAGFGKANGIGDIEALCDEGAVEIGDRIWFDVNGNGIQDANEPGAENVVIELLGPDGSVLSTATSDPSGSYLFSNGKGTSSASERRGVTGLEPNKSGYSIRVKPAQPVLDGVVGATRNADATSGGATRDSDASPSAGGFVVSEIKTGLPGTSNHTLDIGLIPGPKSVVPDGAVRPRVTATPETTASTTRVAQLAPPLESLPGISIPKLEYKVTAPTSPAAPPTTPPTTTGQVKEAPVSSPSTSIVAPSAPSAPTTTKRPRDVFRVAGPAIPKKQTIPNELALADSPTPIKPSAVILARNSQPKTPVAARANQTPVGPARPVLIALTGSNLTGRLIRFGFLSLGFGLALVLISRRKPTR